jgi:hypothetical protein
MQLQLQRFAIDRKRRVARLLSFLLFFQQTHLLTDRRGHNKRTKMASNATPAIRLLISLASD